MKTLLKLFVAFFLASFSTGAVKAWTVSNYIVYTNTIAFTFTDTLSMGCFVSEFNTVTEICLLASHEGKTKEITNKVSNTRNTFFMIIKVKLIH